MRKHASFGIQTQRTLNISPVPWNEALFFELCDTVSAGLELQRLCVRVVPLLPLLLGGMVTSGNPRSWYPEP
jgi:hypothetical protein